MGGGARVFPRRRRHTPHAPGQSRAPRYVLGRFNGLSSGVCGLAVDALLLEVAGAGSIPAYENGISVFKLLF